MGLLVGCCLHVCVSQVWSGAGVLHVLRQRYAVHPPRIYSRPGHVCPVGGPGPGQGSVFPLPFLPIPSSHKAHCVTIPCARGSTHALAMPRACTHDVFYAFTLLPEPAPQRTRWVAPGSFLPSLPPPCCAAVCVGVCFCVAGVSRDVAVFADMSPCPLCFSVGF